MFLSQLHDPHLVELSLGESGHPQLSGVQDAQEEAEGQLMHAGPSQPQHVHPGELHKGP